MGLLFALAVGLMSLSTRRPQGWQGSAAVNVIVLFIGGLALRWLPDWSGLAVAGVFVPFVLAPGLLLNAARSQDMRGRMRAASFYERLACLLHPTPRLRFQAAVKAAMSHGPIEERVVALRALARCASPQQQAALAVNIAIVQGDWNAVLECLHSANGRLRLEFRVWEIRALGELGRLDEMVQAFPKEKIDSFRRDSYFHYLFALAFTGRLEGVRLLLGQEPLLHSKDYWLAIAATGSEPNQEEPRRLMATFASATKNESFRKAAERRLAATPDLVGSALSRESTAIIDAIEQGLLKQMRRMAQPAAPVTVILAVLIVVGFVAEVSHGGSESPGTLIELGALSAPLVLHGEWWWLAASWFLHYGPFHFSLTLYLLFVLGTMCEVKTGSLRMFAIYCLGGLASSTTALLMMWSESAAYCFVGSSGGLVALFGSEVGGLLRDRSYWRTPLGRRRPMTVSRYLLMQTAVIVFLWMDVAFESHSLPLGFTVYAPSLVVGIAINLIFVGQARSAA
jgi:membrane associated rhomboid family serine protease